MPEPTAISRQGNTQCGTNLTLNGVKNGVSVLSFEYTTTFKWRSLCSANEKY